MNNWKIIPSIVLATVLIFGAGVFTGGLLVNYVKPAVTKKNSGAGNSSAVRATNSSTASVSNNPARIFTPLPEMLTKPFLMKLDEQLQLSAEQHKAVEKIINEGQESIKKAVRSSRLEIREMLTPEQLKQFDLLMKHAPHKNNSGINGTASGIGATTTFQERLQAIIESSKANPLSPEAVILLEMEKQRIEARAAESKNLPLPPAPSSTN